MFPIGVLITVVALTAISNVGALQSPTPGHLAFDNALSLNAAGECVGSVSGTYAFKSTDIASGWRYAIDGTCNIVNITWIFLTPIQTAPPVGLHRLSMHDAWAVTQEDAQGFTQAYWLDDVTTEGTYQIPATCMPDSGATISKEDISLIEAYQGNIYPTPASLYTSQVVSTPVPNNPCATLSEVDFVCNPAFACKADGYYKWTHGFHHAYKYLQHSLTHGHSAYGCVTQVKQWMNGPLDTYAPYSQQECKDTGPTTAAAGAAWAVDPTKVFSTVGPGQSVDFTVN